MWRAIIEPALLFLSPFAAYALFHLLQRRWPFVGEIWRGRVVSWLVVAGLVAAIAGVVALGQMRLRTGAWVPAHVEDGRLLPGRFE
jgi:hypothetical protein